MIELLGLAANEGEMDDMDDMDDMDEMAQVCPPAAMIPIYRGWEAHQRRLLDALSPLTDEQLALRPGPDQWAIWQLAANMAGGRAYWLHDILGEGDAAVRNLFRVAATTVANFRVEDAGWEDDEDHPRSARELVDAFARTWRMVDDCLSRWTAVDLLVEFSRQSLRKTQTFTRGWVVWHLIQHELQHGAEIAVILRDHGLPTIEL